MPISSFNHIRGLLIRLGISKKEQDDPLENQLEYFVWDLRSPGMPSWAKTDETQKAIILARIAYLDCPFTQEDQKNAIQLMETAGYDQKKLCSYLSRNYPSMRGSHPLLNLK